jgi:ribosomal protein L5
MNKAIDNASKLASFVQRLNSIHFDSPEDYVLKTVIRPGKIRSEVTVSRLTTIPGEVVIDFFKEAARLGASQSGLKTTTGELYAIYNA